METRTPHVQKYEELRKVMPAPLPLMLKGRKPTRDERTVVDGSESKFYLVVSWTVLVGSQTLHYQEKSPFSFLSVPVFPSETGAGRARVGLGFGLECRALSISPTPYHAGVATSM